MVFFFRIFCVHGVSRVLVKFARARAHPCAHSRLRFRSIRGAYTSCHNFWFTFTLRSLFICFGAFVLPLGSLPAFS